MTIDDVERKMSWFSSHIQDSNESRLGTVSFVQETLYVQISILSTDHSRRQFAMPARLAISIVTVLEFEYEYETKTRSFI